MDEKYIRLDRRINKNLPADKEEKLSYLREKYKIPFKLVFSELCVRPIWTKVDSLYSYSLPVVRNINNILRKNRRILEELLASRKKKVLVIERKKLVEKGFHFEYFTEQIHPDNKNEYYYCYDYGYRSIDNDRVAAIKDTRKKQKTI